MDWNQAITLAKALGAEDWGDIEEMLGIRPAFINLDAIPGMIFASCKEKIIEVARKNEEERARAAGLVQLLNGMEPF